MSDLSLLPVGRDYDHEKLRQQIEHPRVGILWGSRTRFTPRLLDTIWGDGRRLFAVYPIMLRPRYIVARVDSSVETLVDEDVNGDCIIDAIYEAAEDQFYRCNCRACRPDDEDAAGRCDGFPYNIDWSDGSSWGGLCWPDLFDENQARLKYKRKHLLPWRASARIGSALLEAAS